MSRKLATLVVVLVYSLVLVVPAMAAGDGSWTSYLSYVVTGFDSRDWHDPHYTSASTTIRFVGCRDNNPQNGTSDDGTVKLWRHGAWYEPGTSMGSKRLECYSSATGNWGVMSVATYYNFEITHINGAASSYYNLGTSNPGVYVNY